MLIDYLSKKIWCQRNNEDAALTSASWFPYSGADPSPDQINLPGHPGLWEAVCHEKEEAIPADVFLLWNRILGWAKVLAKAWRRKAVSNSRFYIGHHYHWEPFKKPFENKYWWLLQSTISYLFSDSTCQKGNCFNIVCVCVSQSCLTLCDPMDCSLPHSSVHGISQARILEWVALPFSRGSSWPRDQTQVSWIGRRILYHWSTRDFD